ncbi:MAG: hypothetical protein EGR22_07830 [Ruminococcaceae bacterium]|nr:hypothetical protein [Oscillospiraceae bacterium]
MLIFLFIYIISEFLKLKASFNFFKSILNYKNNVEGLYYILKNLFKFDIINWVVYTFYELCFRRENINDK